MQATGAARCDWSEGYRPELETCLVEYARKYHDACNEQIVNGQGEMQLELFDVEIYKPENAKGLEQKFIIALTILELLDWKEYLENEDEDAPPPDSLWLYIQGNPGAGKTFVGRTMLNMIPKFWREMSCSLPVAPTGIAGSLLRGETHVRSFQMPCGKKAMAAPSSSTGVAIRKAQAFMLCFKQLFCCLLDESSMTGRQHWSWMEFKASEAPKCADIDVETLAQNAPRRPANDPTNDPLKFARKQAAIEKKWKVSSVNGRKWGGIPMLVAMGDIYQLPAVRPKCHFDKSAPFSDKHEACALGMQTVQQFLEPLEGTGETGVSVVMDKVIRQKDPVFLENLLKMRSGTVDRKGAEWVLARKLDNLSKEEQCEFEAIAL